MRDGEKRDGLHHLMSSWRQSFTLSDEMIIAPFIMAGTDVLPLVGILLEILQNFCDPNCFLLTVDGIACV